jgi:hypothetical protein
MKEGRLKFADPWTTAAHWKGLNEWDILERHLLSSNPAADPTDIVTAATAAAVAFIKIYATPPVSEEMALLVAMFVVLTDDQKARVRRSLTQSAAVLRCPHMAGAAAILAKKPDC